MRRPASHVVLADRPHHGAVTGRMQSRYGKRSVHDTRRSRIGGLPKCRGRVERGDRRRTENTPARLCSDDDGP